MVARSTGSAQAHAVADRCSLGRILGPGERAAVIRTLEMHVLAADVLRTDLAKKWCVAGNRLHELRLRLAVAREADAILREGGR